MPIGDRRQGPARSPSQLLDDGLLLLELIAGRDADFRAWAAALQDRPLVAGRIFSMANSAAQGLSYSVTRLEHALAILGTNRLRALAQQLIAAGEQATRRKAS